MGQIVNSRTPKTRYQILQGYYVHIKQSPIKGNLHITKGHKSLGGLKTNLILRLNKKYIYRSQHSLPLKIKRIPTEKKLVSQSRIVQSVMQHCQYVLSRLLSECNLSRVVRAPDLKSGGHWFKSRSDHQAGVVSRWTLVQLLGHACK